MSPAAASLRVAAIQMLAVLGDVDANLAMAERLVRRAFAQGAEWAILPEFFTSGVAFHPVMLDAARPVDGAPAQLLRSLARQHGGVVGGSFIALRGEHAYNAFLLAFPDGRTFCHDKDQPTMWESCYYVGGHDDGVLETPAGAVGAALCWELIRTRTARRLLGRVELVVGGSCWWDLPLDAPPEREPLRRQGLALLRAAPSAMAHLLGVPVVHAAHAGVFEGYRMPEARVLQRRRYLGEAQIIDGRGQVLARMGYEDGKGVIVAEVMPGRVAGPLQPIPDRFWIPEMPQPMLDAWERQGRQGAAYYRDVTVPCRRSRAASRSAVPCAPGDEPGTEET